jgi:arylsulfatase A-like enzyme
VISNDMTDIPTAGKKMISTDYPHAQIQSQGKWDNAIQAYLAGVSFADAQVGRILEALDNSKYKNNTIVVVTSDHGYHLGEKTNWSKFTLWEEATRVPLIVRAPGLTPAGSVCTRPVELVSLYPTLTELTHGKSPAGLDGKSFVPLLRNPNAAWNVVAVTTQGYKNHAIRDSRWRYIQYANGSEELYDHSNDPHEWKNLAKNSSFSAIKAGLKARLPLTNAPRR